MFSTAVEARTAAPTAAADRIGDTASESPPLARGQRKRRKTRRKKRAAGDTRTQRGRGRGKNGMSETGAGED